MVQRNRVSADNLKKNVGRDFFVEFDHVEIKGEIDFALKPKASNWENAPVEEYLLWAMVRSVVTDPLLMLTHFVLAIGKRKIYERIAPPRFLGCFDREKIVFVPFANMLNVFYRNDFNWKIAPSNRNTKEFMLVHALTKETVRAKETNVFAFDTESAELQSFIRRNFVTESAHAGPPMTKITRNNFKWVYDKWLSAVRPTISINWYLVKKTGVTDGDLYLADLLSARDVTLTQKQSMLLSNNSFVTVETGGNSGFLLDTMAEFDDDQRAHRKFWSEYERPNPKEYWDCIVHHRDLLVPRDIRERKGSFYTPSLWVELSQNYIAGLLGENWQEEYYVWDCAAGTGNLLAGLTNPNNVWASTIDRTDVEVIRERIQHGANLLENHVFVFDFLNDDFSKLPEKLKDIIVDEEIRKKLVVYINPPYAEAMNLRHAQNAKTNVNRSEVEKNYVGRIGKAARQLYALFLSRVYGELGGCILAHFSPLKAVLSPNYADFRRFFRSRLLQLFVVPAYTFENVSGQFPIGFFVWDTGHHDSPKEIKADVYDRHGSFICTKSVSHRSQDKTINRWLKQFVAPHDELAIGAMCCVGTDFQHANFVNINHMYKLKGVGDAKGIAKFVIAKSNLVEACVYMTVRHCITPNWLNADDQFCFPNDSWSSEREFLSDCVAYTLFHSHNNISSRNGTNHWIPFTESEIGAHSHFRSTFMSDFIYGILPPTTPNGTLPRAENLWHQEASTKMSFSTQATELFNVARKLWKHYHKQPEAITDASLYDIREHFQGRNKKGNMNVKSADHTYNELIANLRAAIQVLAKKIEPKVYEYGFLMSSAPPLSSSRSPTT